MSMAAFSTYGTACPVRSSREAVRRFVRIGLLATGMCGLLLVAEPRVAAAIDDASVSNAEKAAKAATFTLRTRSRKEPTPGCGHFDVVDVTVEWKADETAVIICDMWNQHWCKSATRRVGEMAERMNETVKAARRKGALIIHAPSSTVKFYDKSPQRQRARTAPKVEPPVEIAGWCHLDKTREAALPIDDTDGGCDCQPQCKTYTAWTRQHPGITIALKDAISDDGREIYNLLEQHGVKNVLLMGVHTNMCVLGRPFGIRQLCKLGKNVALVRDLTDTMYNPRMKPFVSHQRGTELVIEHVEKYWAPTVTSHDVLGEEK